MEVAGTQKFKVKSIDVEYNNKKYTVKDVVVFLDVKGQTEYYCPSSRYTPSDWEVDYDSLEIDSFRIDECGDILDSDGNVIEDDNLFDEIATSEEFEEEIEQYDFEGNYDEVVSEDIHIC